MRRGKTLYLFLLISVSSFAQGRSSQSVELVVDQGANSDEERKIQSVDFKDDSTLRVLFSHGRDTTVLQIGGDENSATFGAPMLAHNAASLAGNTLVALAPLQAEIFDLRRQRAIKTLKVDGIDAWPLVCEEKGLCAWQSGEKLHVEPFGEGGRSFDFQVGQSAVLSLGISPDRQFLAAGLNEARVRVWRLRDGQELPALPMEATSDGSLVGAPVSVGDVVPRSFVFPRPGMATVVRFSPDGLILAAANETGVHLWTVKNWERSALLRGYQGRVSALAFADSRTVAVASEDKVVRLFRFGQQPSVVEVCRLAVMPHFLAVRKDGGFVAAGFADGSIELWNTTKKELGAKVRVFGDGWIATTPAGLFDTSEQAWHRASWIFHGKGNVRVPMEAFYRDFYRAGLLSDVLTGAQIPAGPEIGSTIPELPKVTITAVETKPPKAELIPGQGIKNVPERIRFRVEARPGREGGVVADLQVALNGIVVKKWARRQAVAKTGSTVQEVELEMPPGDLRVSASAYNESNLRSTEAVWQRPMQGFGYQVPQRTLFVLGIGIRTYKNPKFNLSFADSDVLLLAKALGLPEADLQQMSRRLMEWGNRRMLEPFQSSRLYEVPARVQVKTLLNEQATKSAVIDALRELTKTAQPKDAVLIFYAGHGLYYANHKDPDQSHYYILPWDMALSGGPGAITGQAVSAVRGSLISDDEIAAALAELNVKYGALILDSCYSGRALEGAELLGPINPQGLTGWAYEKGISLLAASEASEPSFELKKLGTSVLMTALVKEGLLERKADTDPLDGSIELEEWLRYAVSRLPSLVREATGSKARSGSDAVQSARLVPSRVARKEWLVVAAAEKEPQ
jgi:WD40 repeat protein